MNAMEKLCPSRIALLVVVAVCISRTALAAVVATGTLTAECDVNSTGLCCATVLFDDATKDVFGTPVNLGSGVGTIVNTDTFVPAFDPVTASGTFSGSFDSSPVAGLLSFVGAGSFLCAGANPNCVLPVSFIGSLSGIGGSVGLPSGNVYTEDGTLNYVSTGSPSTPGCPIATVNALRGPYAINGFHSEETPPGSNVTNSMSTTFYNSATGTEVTVATDVTFSNVTGDGQTTLTTVSNAAGVVDSSFAVDVAYCSIGGQPCSGNSDCAAGETCNGYHAAFFDLSTTAAFSGPVTICGHYDDAEVSPPGGNGIVDGTTVAETSLRILHKATGSDEFVDVTTSRDTVANTICGEVTSFSPFVIAASSPCGNTFAARSKLVLSKINTDTTAGNDGLLVKGEFTLPNTTSFAALDPVATGAQVVLTSTDNLPKVTIKVPSGAYGGAGTAGWVLNGAGDKWTFHDKTGSPQNGIVKVIVKDRGSIAPGQVQVQVNGHHGTYPIVTADAPVQAAIVLGGATAVAAGDCGRSSFVGSQCAFNGAANKLTCRQ